MTIAYIVLTGLLVFVLICLFACDQSNRALRDRWNGHRDDIDRETATVRSEYRTVREREQVLKSALEQLAEAEIHMAKFTLRAVYGDEDS